VFATSRQRAESGQETDCAYCCHDLDMSHASNEYTKKKIPLASRSRTVHLPFNLLVSFRTSAHRMYCCIFHSGHTLNQWSRACEGHLHYWDWT